jgi:hypothetical protein
MRPLFIVSIAAVIGLVAISIAMPIQGKESSSSIYKDRLLSAIREAAKKENMSWVEVEDTLFELLCLEPAWKKGNLGIVNPNLYIAPDHDKNQLIVYNKTWTGLPAYQSQIVIVDGQQVLSSPKSDLSKIAVIIFSPREVRFIDYATKRAGVYLREHEAKPPFSF